MGAFADGLQEFFTKGIKAPKVKLTKNVARVLIDIVRDQENETARKPEHTQDDWCAALQWIANQVYSKWSQADLFTDTHKKKTSKKK